MAGASTRADYGLEPDEDSDRHAEAERAWDAGQAELVERCGDDIDGAGPDLDVVNGWYFDLSWGVRNRCPFDSGTLYPENLVA